MANLEDWLNKTFGGRKDQKAKKRNLFKRNKKVKMKNNSSKFNNKQKAVHNQNEQEKRSKNKKTHSKKHKNNQNNNFVKIKGGKNKNMPIKKGVLRIIPMGGLNEIGQNMMIFEYEKDIILIDMGFMFPDADLMGVDYVIPDTTYLEKRKNRIRAVIITHGHLDHIGGIPYMIEKLGFPPLYGLKLSMGLTEQRLEEFKLLNQTRLNIINVDDKLKFGAFDLSFFRVNHSIPDSMGVHIKSPAGSAVHTGDFKFDETPADGIPAQTDKMIAIGNQKEKVGLLLSDSTNATKAGKTTSEMEVGETLDDIIKNTNSRLIIASFSSLIGRVGQIIEYAHKHGRKIFISGRSMEKNIELAARLGYIKVPANIIQPIKKVNEFKSKEVLVLTTGSQGEPMSALTRISLGNHADVSIRKGDTVVVSSSPIPGNEVAIYTLINNLARAGAHVIHNGVMDVHVSGHGARDDLRRMIEYIRPKKLAPIHGEFFMRQAHGDIAIKQLRYKQNQILLAENGNIIEIQNNDAKLVKEKIPNKYILIDGRGKGSQDHAIISDRQFMSQNGVLMPLFRINKKTRKLKGDIDIVSRGFIYMDESEEITNRVRDHAKKAYIAAVDVIPKGQRGRLKEFIRQKLDKKVNKLISRRPLIIPIIIEE